MAHVLAVQTTANAGWEKAPSQGVGPEAGSCLMGKSIFESLLASGPAPA